MSVFTVIQLILNSYVLMVMMAGALLNNAHHNYVHNNEKNYELSTYRKFLNDNISK